MKCVVIIHLITKKATVRGPAIREEGEMALLLSSQIVTHIICGLLKVSTFSHTTGKNENKTIYRNGFKNVAIH